MTKEEEYDQLVAPLLNEAAKKAQELGFSLICRCEWEPGESGLTRVGDPKISVGQAMAWWAAHVHGNFDALGMQMIREYDVSRSIFLHSYNKHTASGPPPAEFAAITFASPSA